jgi:hypothetical protein
MNNIRKYLRELSIVVLGIAITLSLSVWISNKNEKRDMALYLNAIKMELEDNITIIDTVMEYFQNASKYEKYLSLHDNQSLHEDSLAYYVNSCCYLLPNIQLNTNAFDMFKNAGVMRLVSNKDLLMSIWNAYNSCAALNVSLDKYCDKKYECIEKEAVTLKNGELDFKELKYVKHAPMYNFYAPMLATAILNNRDKGLEPIKETLAKLERRK